MKKTTTWIDRTGLFLCAAILITALTVLAAGCGSSDADSETSGSASDVQQIIVGTYGMLEPYNYLDEDGNITGYEIDILKAVDELLEEYEFSYQTLDASSLLTALDAGTIDISVCLWEKNDEREENYLYAEESYLPIISYVVVAADNDEINSIDDLSGKNVYGYSSGSNQENILQTWNENNPTLDAINIITTASSTEEEIVTAIKSGIYDAIIQNVRWVDRVNEAYGDGADVVKVVGDSVYSSDAYFVYKKGNTELQEAVDEALRTLIEDGTLSEISIEYLDRDYFAGTVD